ncbi:MAG: class I SAM-dependent methyltransferase [Acidobacteriia bacterium]|nr:class I SAM-dependent methyltransferase [Terriglobia bacterium]
MKSYLRSVYWSMKRLVAPEVIGSQVKYGEVLLRHLERCPRWLDLGCGHQFLPHWAWDPDWQRLRALPRMIGVDYDFESLKRHAHLRDRVRSDIDSLPFRSRSFDLVTANMVMEHVTDPERIVSEVRRVLVPGGVFLFHTPNRSSPLMALAAHVPQSSKRRLISFFEDRGEADIYPAVYRFNTEHAVAEIGRKAGFTLESCRFEVSEAVTQVLGPLAVFELLYIRLTQWKRLARLRPDIIGVLRAK